MTDKAALLRYYERRTCSAQWMECNRAFAAELSAGLPPEGIRQVFRRIGERIALAMAFGPAAEDWAGGFFEGACQTWLAAQGTPPQLRVQAEAARANGSSQVTRRLGRFEP